MKDLFSESNARFTLIGKASPDRMKIFIEARPGEGGPHQVSAKDLNAIIAPYVPQRLLHERVVEEAAEMLSRGEVVSERRISKGEDAQPGLDGKQVIMVKAFTEKPDMAQDQRGFMQLHELHLFDNVQKGQVLARIYPPHGGSDGHDAFGKVIPSKPGKPFKPNYDKKTVEVKKGEGFETLNALMPGYLQVEGGALRIVEDLVVSGNVDFHVGNIDFVGSVTIRGDVMPGFTVQAEKGIVVTGNVHRASLLCRSGGVECRGSISGGGSVRIVAPKFLKAKVLHEVIAEVGGDLLLEKEARDSELYVQGVMRADAAALLGGVVRTARGVQVKQLGYNSGKITQITLCSNVETRHEFTQLLSQIEAHEKALGLLELHLGPLAKYPTRVQLLKEPHRGKMEKLLQKLASVSHSLDHLRGQKMKLLESGSKAPGLRVNVVQVAHQGVKVSAGEHVIVLDQDVSGPKTLMYDADKGEFRWQDFAALEEEKSDEQKKGKEETAHVKKK